MIRLVPLATGAEVAFWLLAPVMILAALGLLFAKKAVHCALCLATVMISLAVQYAALQAPFLFVVQIIVYTGAILMLFLFVLMLVGVDTADSLIETIKGQRTLAVIAGLGLGSLLIFAVGNAIVGQPAGLGQANADYGGNVQGIAALLFTRYVFAFEATSGLLITAAVGAMVLAHRERLTKKKTQADLVAERMRRYAEAGEHPGPLPTPGVFARHNAVDTPALLPDGTIAERSVSATLKSRGEILDSDALVSPIRRTVRAISGHASGEGDPAVYGRGTFAGTRPEPTRPEPTRPEPSRPEPVEGPDGGLRRAQATATRLGRGPADPARPDTQRPDTQRPDTHRPGTDRGEER